MNTGRVTAERIEQWRRDTPGTAARIHLNNAGAALMPRPVIDAIQAHVALEAEAGGYEAADLRGDAIEATYGRLAELVGAEPRNLAVVSSATMAFAQALSALDLGPGDTVITSRCDYTSNQIQYLSLARRRGVRVVHAPDLPEGGIDPAAVRELLARDPCRLVAVSWVPTNSGLVQDVVATGEVCEEAGVPFLVDACQAVGQIPVDVGALRCDYLSATGRKFLRGPRGIGFLYVSDRALDRGEHPLFVDMRGARWTDADGYELVPDARRFEEWEAPYALVLGLSEAARYALETDVGAAGARAAELAEYVRTRLRALPGVRVLDRGAVRCAIVTADVGRDAERVVAELFRRGVNTSASLGWYGVLDFADKGVDSALRVSPHYYNTEAEVDAMIDALTEALA